MNAHFRIALSCLKKQRRSSLLLLGTVIISAAFLVCMCVVGASSIYTSTQTRMDLYGEYKAVIWGTDENTEEFLSAFPIWNELGKTEIYGTFEGIDGKTHVLGRADEVSLKLLRAELTEGRMPQTYGEAVFEKSMARQLGLESLSVGDDVLITLSSANGEQTDIILTVCGIAENFSAVKNNELSDSSTVTVIPSVLVCGFEHPPIDSVWFLNSESEDFFELRASLPKTAGSSFNSASYPHGYNALGVNTIAEETTIAISVMAIVGGLILVCTATVTMNGFIMSVDRRSRQMSLLRCIGATKKQAFKIIAAEGMILLGAGLVPGLAFGTAISGLAVRLFSSLAKTELIWKFAPWSLPLAAVLCSLCVLSAILIPAFRASRKPPIFAASASPSAVKRKRKTPGRPLGVLGITGVSVRNSLGRTLMTGLVFCLVIVVSGFATLIIEMNKDSVYSMPDVEVLPTSNSISYEGDEFSMSHAPFFVNYEALTRYLSIPTELPEMINSEMDFACTWSYIEPRFGVSVPKSEFDDYLNGFFIYDAEKLELPQSGGEDIVGIPTGKYPFHSDQKQYGIGEDEYLINTYVFACSDELLKRLSPKLTSGRIDLDAIKRGDEVILTLPNYEIDYSNYPYGQSTRILGSGENSPYIEGMTFKNENWTAGDKFTLTWVDIDTDGNAVLCRKEVTVGATVEDGLSQYGMPAQVFGLYVLTDTLNNISAPHSIRELNLYFPLDTEIEVGEKEVTTWIFENYPSLRVRSKTEVNQAEQQLQRMTVGIIATVISCLVSLGFLGLVNTASVRINSRSHQLGLLRCIGMTKPQILLMLAGEGGCIGLGASVFGIALCRIIFPFLTENWRFPSLGVTFAVASVLTVLLAAGTIFIPALKVLRSSPVETTRKAE